MKECRHLTKLSLHQIGRLNDAILKELSDSCPSIEEITIDGAYSLTDSSLIYFVQSHPHLMKLNLHWTYQFTKNFVEELCKICTNLTHLNFSCCTRLNDSMLEPIQNLSQIQTFCLESSPALTDQGLSASLLKSLSTITELNIRDCCKITDAFLVSSFTQPNNLKKLVLETLPGITDEGIQSIFPHCNKLEELSLNGCKKLTNKSVNKILSSCSSLSILQIKGLSLLEKSDFINSCIPAMKNLSELNLSWCGMTDDEVLQKLGETCLRLRKLVLWGVSVSDVCVANLLKKGIEIIGQDIFSIELI